MAEENLRKYTTLTVLYKILREKKIILFDPNIWEDKNDVMVLMKYKEECKFEAVLATCFAKAEETYLMWKAYAGNENGVCIEFNEYELISSFPDDQYLKKEISYTKIINLGKNNISKGDLPFIKRYPYSGEKEYRIIYSSSEKVTSIDVPITLTCIKRIIINPWISQENFKLVKKDINRITGCEDLVIRKSSVLSNKEWKNKVTNLNF